MLTIKSRYFKERQGQEYTGEELKKLFDNLILPDVVNFPTTKEMSLGFPENTAKVIIETGKIEKKKKILILNDLSFNMINELLRIGCDYNDITIAYGTWGKDACPSDNPTVYNIMKEIIKHNIAEPLNVIELKGIFESSMKYDFIIANPPYAIGNKITKAIVENVDFDKYINLMPASKYKGGELYKKVLSLSGASDDFEDAFIGDSLTVATLEKKDTDVYDTYDEFENEKRDPKYQEFYRLNAECEQKYMYAACNRNFKCIDEAMEKLRGYYAQIDTRFCITMRTPQNGVHKTEKCHDYRWNILEKVELGEFISQYKDGSKTDIVADFMDMHSALEKDNFCRFWYDNSLMHELIKGFRKNGGSIAGAIPQIDFSVERDYEHLTLEDIMKILREENPNVSN